MQKPFVDENLQTNSVFNAETSQEIQSFFHIYVNHSGENECQSLSKKINYNEFSLKKKNK